MLKVFSLIKRREDLSLDEFRTWILEQHAPMGRELPGLREYKVSVIENDDPALPYHAVTELYFDDEDALQGGVRERGRQGGGRRRRRPRVRPRPPAHARGADHLSSTKSA